MALFFRPIVWVACLALTLCSSLHAASEHPDGERPSRLKAFCAAGIRAGMSVYNYFLYAANESIIANQALEDAVENGDVAAAREALDNHAQVNVNNSSLK
jgi:hypothetical protein